VGFAETRKIKWRAGQAFVKGSTGETLKDDEMFRHTPGKIRLKLGAMGRKDEG
jgi:hypothetical protein